MFGKVEFPCRFGRIVVRYKKIGYNIDVLRQTSCLVNNQIKVDSFACLFDCTTVSRYQAVWLCCPGPDLAET